MELLFISVIKNKLTDEILTHAAKLVLILIIILNCFYIHD